MFKPLLIIMGMTSYIFKVLTYEKNMMLFMLNTEKFIYEEDNNQTYTS